MKRKITGILVGLLLVSLMVVSVSAVQNSVQLRPMNQIDHPGLTSPYVVSPSEGPNHQGPSDYTNKWTGVSELCERDWQIRPANQGYNIPQFFTCHCESG